MLDGRAGEIVQRKTPANFNEVKIILEQNFKKQTSLSNSTIEFKNVKQRFNENINDYINRFENLVYELTEESRVNETPEAFLTLEKYILYQAKIFFEEGLNSDLKFLIKSRNYNSLSDSITGTREEGKKIITKFENQIENNIVCVKCNKPGYFANNCRIISNRINSNIIKREVICSKCNNPGHYANNCNAKFNNYENNSNRPNTSRYCSFCKMTNHSTEECGLKDKTNFNLTCFKCHKSGHMSKNCMVNTPSNSYIKKEVHVVSKNEEEPYSLEEQIWSRN